MYHENSSDSESDEATWSSESSSSLIEEDRSSGFSEKEGGERLSRLQETFEYVSDEDSMAETRGVTACSTQPTKKKRRGIHDYRTVKDLPENTSKWLQNEEMKTHVFRVFKTRRLKIDVEKVLWPYYVSDMNCDIWLESLKLNNPMYEGFTQFFCECLSPMDFDPLDWFYHSCGSSARHLLEKPETNLTQDARKLMVAVMASRDQAVLNANLNTNTMVRKMDDEFMYWFESLTDLLRKSPSRLNESAYKHIFESFVKLFGLSCKPGDYEKLEIPYEVWSDTYKKTVIGIRSKPDLILYGFHDVRRRYVQAIPLAIVEVKQPVGFVKSKNMQRGSRKRILAQLGRQRSEELLALKAEYEQQSLHSESKRAKLNNEESQPDQTDKEHLECEQLPQLQAGDVSATGQDSGASGSRTRNVTGEVTCQNERMYEEVDYGKLPPSAEIPSDDEKKFWNSFLPQLVGEVVAAGSLRCDGDKRTSMAIAVVGYSVIFLNFCCQKNHHFDDIPLTPGLGLDVFISEELCILKKADREKICKLLLCLTTIDELPF